MVHQGGIYSILDAASTPETEKMNSEASYNSRIAALSHQVFSIYQTNVGIQPLDAILEAEWISQLLYLRREERLGVKELMARMVRFYEQRVSDTKIALDELLDQLAVEKTKYRKPFTVTKERIRSKAEELKFYKNLANNWKGALKYLIDNFF